MVDLFWIEPNSAAERELAGFQARAFDLLSTAATREAFRIDLEPSAVRDRYGRNIYGQSVLLARRLVEAGVRFVEVCHGGWDQHRNLKDDHARHSLAVDRPISGLLTDLKRRGLLDETLVIWGGEFGRQPTAEYAAGTGRDHNAYGFTMWMAGGGVKGGTVVGATDEVGLKAMEDRAHVNDLHATILHLMGLDHTQLTVLHNGRDERLTDVGGRVLRKLLA